MELFLPDIDWQGHKWTAKAQTRKIAEESFEVVEAIANDDLENAVKETLDIIQTGFTMLSILEYDWEHFYCDKIPLSYFMDEHSLKLRKKGYLKEEDDHALDSVF